MSAALLNPGDELDATVGETVRIRIDEFDAVEHRFRASTV